MSIELNNGEIVPLNLVLEGGETTKFPQAHLFNMSGVEVAGSPFDLAHVALGYYKNHTFSAVFVDQRYFAVYRVYNDLAHTIAASTYFERTEDVFDITGGFPAGMVASWYIAVPEVMELPTTGTKEYRFVIYFFDAANQPVDPDSDEVYVHIEDINNGEILTPQLLTKEQTGVYWYKYEILWNQAEQPVWVEFTFDSNSIPFLIGDVSDMLRVRAVLDVFETVRLTAVRCANLDNLDVTVSSRESEADALVKKLQLQAEINTNEVKIDNITTLIGLPYGGSLTTHLNAIKSETDKIGNPATGTIGGALAQIQVDTVKIGTPFTGTVSGDILAVYTRIGAPTGVSISADLVAIKTDTTKIGIPFYGTLAADNLHTFSLIGTPVVSVSDDIALVQGTANAINGKLGVPHTGTIAGDLHEIIAKEDTLLSRLSAGRASNLDYLDVYVSSRASQSTLDAYYTTLNANDVAILAAIGAVPNNTTFVGIVPPVLVLPASPTPSKDYKFYVNIFNQDGSPGDPDFPGNVVIKIEDVTGATVVGSTNMTVLGTGRFSFAYQVLSSDIERSLYVIFEYTKNANFFRHIRITEVQEFESKLDVLLQRLTNTRAMNLDNLDVAVSTRQSSSTALTQYTDLNADIQFLQFDFDAFQTLIGTPLSVSLVDDINQIRLIVNKIGNPAHGTLAADNVAIQLEVNKIGTPVYGTLSGNDTEILARIGLPVLGSLALDIASVKLDTVKIGVPHLGTLASDLHDIRAKMGVLAGATTIESLFSTIDLSPIIALLGTPVTTIAGDIAAVKTVVDGHTISLTTIASHTVKIGAPHTGTLAGDLHEIIATLGVPVTTIAGDIANIDIDTGDITDILTIVTTIQTRLGDPSPDTVASDLNTIISLINALPDNCLQADDFRLNYLDAYISSRATPGDVISGSSGLSLFEMSAVVDDSDEIAASVEMDDEGLTGMVEDIEELISAFESIDVDLAATIEEDNYLIGNLLDD